MLKRLNEQCTELKWLNCEPNFTKKIALLIPQYNEGSNADFIKRLHYFKCIANEFKEILDVIIIDDGSNDNSLQKIKDFLVKNSTAFYVAAVFPNANKVGALYLANEAISHQYVVLSDFDTDIVGYDKLVHILKNLEEDESLMGGYYRMLPFEGSGIVFNFQQLEYTLDRILYRLHKKQSNVPVMPGAGSFYKRIVLSSIYKQHSGLRNGEDREATLIGMKLGYNAVYYSNILTLTRPPLTFKNLITQRIRWNLGYIETLAKERQYYFELMKNFNWIGLRLLMDSIKIIFIILFPIFVLIIGFQQFKLLYLYFLLTYIFYVTCYFFLLISCPNESKEIRGKRVYLILMFPFFKLCLDYIAWGKAILKFLK